MPKKKTSTKQESFLKNMPTKSLKKGTKAFSASKKMPDTTFIAKVLTESLLDGDSEAFKEILSAHLGLINIDSFYKKAGVSRRSLFRMLSPEGNPTLANITKVICALKEVA